MSNIQCQIYKFRSNKLVINYIDSIDVTELLTSFQLNQEIEQDGNTTITLSLRNSLNEIHSQLEDIGLYFTYTNIVRVIDNINNFYLIKVTITINGKPIESVSFLDNVEINSQTETITLNCSSIINLLKKLPFNINDYNTSTTKAIATVSTFIKVMEDFDISNLSYEQNSLFTGLIRDKNIKILSGTNPKNYVLEKLITPCHLNEIESQDQIQNVSDIVSYPAQSDTYFATTLPVYSLVEAMNTILVFQTFATKDRLALCLAPYEAYSENIIDIDIVKDCTEANVTSSYSRQQSVVFLLDIPLINESGDRMKIANNKLVIDTNRDYRLRLASFFTEQLIETEVLGSDRVDISNKYEESIIEHAEGESFIIRSGMSVDDVYNELAYFAKATFSNVRDYFNFTIRLEINPIVHQDFSNLQIGNVCRVSDNNKFIGNYKVTEEAISGDGNNLTFRYVLSSFITIL